MLPTPSGRNVGAASGEGAAGPAPWALASLAVSMLLSSLGTSIANVALPTLSTAFDAPFREVQWVVLAYLLAVTTLIVVVGRLGDLVGRRRLLLTGISIFTGASILCGLAPTLGLLIAFRAAQGLGAAAMMALAMAMVGEAVAKERAGRAMGMLGTMSAIGTALGPSLGGALIAGAGWRAIFLVNVPLGLLALALAQRGLPAETDAPRAAPAGFDVAGTLLLVATLAAYALAMTVGRGRLDGFNLALLVAAFVGAGLFGVVEKRSASPLIRLTVLGDGALSSGLATSALVSTVIMTTMVVGPFYLARTLGLDAARVGLVLSVGPLVAALTAVPAGRLVDRLGASPTSIAGLLGMAAGALMLAMLPERLGTFAYVGPIVVVTGGYAFFQTGNNTAVMSGIGTGERGVVSGMLNLSRNLGLVTGASAMGAVFAFATASTDLATARPAAVASGMRSTFAVAAALLVGSLVLTLRSYAAMSRSRRPFLRVSPPGSPILEPACVASADSSRRPNAVRASSHEGR